MNTIIFHNGLVFIGCGLGGLCRYWLSVLTYTYLLKSFPLGTLFINVLGSFCAGLIFTFLAKSSSAYHDIARLLLLTGFCGGFTTFSSFSLESIQLMQQGFAWQALLNISLNVMLCLLAVYLGITFART